MQDAPKVPNYAAIDATVKNDILRAAQKKTKTILTNPLGETDSPIIQKKKLVGKLGD